MQNRVVVLKPRAISFDEVLAAYRAARYDDCLTGLHQHHTLGARTLRIRALLRLGRPEAALEALGEIDADLPTVERAEFHLLTTSALLRLGRTRDAESSVLGARVAAYSSCSAALEADYELHEANVAQVQGDSQRALEAVARALAVSEPAQPWVRRGRAYFLSLGLVRARALEFRGVLARGNEGLRAQRRFGGLALRELDADPQEDQWLRAVMLANYALVTVEAADAGAIDELRERMNSVGWTGSLDLWRFHVIRSLGWLHALNGNHLAAFREFRTSAQYAPSRAWKLLSVLDRSFLARELGQDLFADDEFRHAVELSNEIGPSLTDGDTPAFLALVYLAQLAARHNAAEARALLERYRAARAKIPSLIFDGRDPKWRAHEYLAEAELARAEGRTQIAFSLFVNAFDAFDKLENRWRAATAALELAELSGEPFFIGYAAREARRRPQSWMARRLSALSAKGPRTLQVRTTKEEEQTV